MLSSFLLISTIAEKPLDHWWPAMAAVAQMYFWPECSCSDAFTGDADGKCGQL
jgi:hypothetical protein